MPRYMPWIVLVTISAIWGGSFAAIRYVVSIVSPSEFLIIRNLMLSAITIPWLFIAFRKEFFSTAKKLWWYYIFLAALWLYGYHYLLNIGETVIPAATSGLIIATAPIWTLIFASVFKMEKLTWGKGLGAAIAFAGTVLMTYFGAGEEGLKLNIEPRQWILYSLMVLCAAILISLHTLSTKPFIRGTNRFNIKLDPIMLSVTFMSLCGFLAMILWKPGTASHIFISSTGYWLAMIYLVLFCTVVANIGWFWVIKHMDVGRSSISIFLIPLFALLYSWLLLDEPMHWPTFVGAAGIIMGVGIAGFEGIYGKLRRKIA